MPAPASRHRIAAGLAVLLVWCLAFAGSRALWEPDEGRYTDVALEMVDSGDWLRPRLHHELPHYTKPPLAYWSVGGSIAAFGRSEWAVRLPVALAFFGTVLVLWQLGGIFVRRRPWLPALVYATMALPYAAAEIVNTDSFAAFFTTLSVLGFCRYRFADGGRRWLYLLWGGLGLAFLAKGPPTLLPLLAMLVFCIKVDGWRSLGRLVAVGPLLLFAAAGFGWYLAVALTTPGVLDYWWSQEVVARIASNQHHRNGQWYGAFVVYLPTLLLGTLPWGLALASRRCWRRARQRLRTRSSKRRAETWFLGLWFAVPLVVFALARSRLPLYLLPLMAPVALVAARRLQRLPVARLLRIAVPAALVLLALRAVAGVVDYPERDSREFAAWIAAHSPFAPQEVVFVQRRPFYGLSFYLDCEVEPVGWDGGRRPGFANDLAYEFAEGEPDQVYVVMGYDAERFLAAADAAGRSVQRLGDYLDMRLFASRR